MPAMIVSSRQRQKRAYIRKLRGKSLAEASKIPCHLSPEDAAAAAEAESKLLPVPPEVLHWQKVGSIHSPSGTLRIDEATVAAEWLVESLEAVSIS